MKGQQVILLNLFLVTVFMIRLNAQFCNPIDTFILIEDNQSTSIQITVNGVLNNNLASPTQGLCAVQIEFEHTQLSDLTMTLNSPAGQQVELIGPYVVNFPTPFSDWSVVFTQCGFPASPDPGFNSTWNNEGPWAAFGDYTGTYYPHDGCLEDFNTGPVNGTWTLNITDNIQFDEGTLISINLLFCDPTGIDCSLCAADAGSFILQDTSYFCQGDPSLLFNTPGIVFDSLPDSTQYRYEFIQIQNDTIYSVENTLDFTALDTGTYKLCGLSFNKNDSVFWENLVPGTPYHELVDQVYDPNSSFCADLTQECIVIDILPNENMVDTTLNLCIGDTIYFENQAFFEPGDYYLVDDTDGPCSKTTFLHVQYYELETSIQADDFILSCTENAIELNGTIQTPYSDVEFEWVTEGGSFLGETETTSVMVTRPGIYYFIATKDNCPDTSAITIVSDGSLPEYFVSAPSISCNNPSIIIELIPVSPISEIQWTAPDNQVFTTEDPMVDLPGIYLLELTGENGCVSLGSVEVNIDTIRPSISLQADTLSCSNPATVINLNSSDDLITVFWPELGTNLQSPIVSSPGLYHVEASGPNGCITYDSIQIIGEFNYPDFNISFDTLTCYQDSTLLDFTSMDTNLSIEWTAPDLTQYNTEDIWVGSGGNYQLSVTNTSDCTVDTIIEVAEDFQIPQFDIPDTLVIPCDEDFIQFNPVITGPYDSLVWFGPGSFESSFPTPFISVTGSYYLEVTGINGCKGIDTTVVSSPPEIPPLSILIDTIDCDTQTGTITIQYTGDLSFSWEDEDGNLFTGTTISSTEPGDFQLTVTDNTFNCTSEQVVSLPLDTFPPLFDVMGADTLNCLYPETILLVNSNLPTEQIHWLGNGLDVTGNSALIDQPGWYTIEVTGKNGCISIDSVEIFENSSFIPEPDTFYIDCVADSVQLNIANLPVDEYLWTLNGNFISNEPSPFVFDAGQYQVKVNTDDGCSDSTLVYVLYDQELPEFQLSIEGEINCVDTSVVLVAQPISPLIDYEWFGPGLFSTELTDTAFMEGTYYFRATGENMCENLDSIQLLANRQFPEVTAIGDAIDCNDQQSDLLISGNIIGNYSGVLWTGPDFFSSTNVDNIVQDTGQYILRVEGSKGCYSYDTTYVLIDTLPPAFTFNRPDTITCVVETVELNIDTEDEITSLYWTGNNGYMSTTLPTTVGEAGTYWIQVTGANGCINTGTVTVPQNKLQPYIDLQTLDISCNRVKVPLILTTSATSFFAEWHGPNNYSYTGPAPAVKDTGMYFLVLTDLNNGCQNTDSIRVNSDLEPPVTFTQDHFLRCDDQAITIDIDVAPGPATYNWEGPAGFISFEASPEVTVDGTYYVTVTRTDNGCSSIDSLEVIDDPVYPEINMFINPMDCVKDSAQLVVTQYMDLDSVLWTGPSGFESRSFDPIVYEPGDYHLFVYGQNGCVSDSLFTVEPDTLQPVTNIVFNDFLVCEKTTGRLDASESSGGAGFDIEWSTTDGLLLSGLGSLNPLIDGEGTYYLQITNTENGCQSMDSIVIEMQDSPLDSMQLELTPPSCLGFEDGEIRILSVFEGSEPFEFSLNEAKPSLIPYFPNLGSGQYQVRVIDDNGCILDSLVRLDNGGQLSVSVVADPTIIQLGEQALLTGIINSDNAIVGFEWSPQEWIDLPNQLEVLVSPDRTTLFTLIAEDEAGCIASDQIEIQVIEKPEIYIPNVFTPNGDNINDVFSVKTGNGVEQIVLFEIFDRWGNKLFVEQYPSSNTGISWDGRHNGKMVLPGVYIYHIACELSNGEIMHKAGDITLIR